MSGSSIYGSSYHCCYVLLYHPHSLPFSHQPPCLLWLQLHSLSNIVPVTRDTMACQSTWATIIITGYLACLPLLYYSALVSNAVCPPSREAIAAPAGIAAGFGLLILAAVCIALVVWSTTTEIITVINFSLSPDCWHQFTEKLAIQHTSWGGSYQCMVE